MMLVKQIEHLIKFGDLMIKSFSRLYSQNKKIMVKIFFHTRTSSKLDWTNVEREFSRVPSIGEYVCLESSDENWHRIELVVHTPFHCPFDAEVYAVAENHLDIMKAACNG